MEKTLTDKMYSTITNKRFFEQEVLNSGSEHYFYYKIQNFTKYKNSLLITNEELKHRYEVLSVFNNQIQSIMFEIIVSYRLVIDCNKTNEKLHFDGLKIRLNSKLEYINRFFIPSIRYNYDDNHLLGYKMNEYCISAFDTMFDKLENDYMIDIKKSPLFSSIENVYKKYLNLFDVEKMKVLSIPIHTTNQPEEVKPDEKYKTQNLFKVGLLFATGEMNKYFTINSSNKELVSKNGLSPLKIAKELGNPSFDKWILASKNNYLSDNKSANKNIFNNLDMMNKIINHCKAENIEVDPYFMSRLPIE